jgi:hypothetical protein
LELHFLDCQYDLAAAGSLSAVDLYLKLAEDHIPG